MNVLNNEQAVFAAENHELIYQFLNSRRLPENEYYDTVVFAFLECVMQSCDGNFKERAFTAMDNAVSTCQKDEVPETISLSDYMDSFRTVEDTLFAQNDEINDLLERMDTEALLTSFNEIEQEILILLLNGFCFTEIAFRLKQTASQLSYTLAQIKAKAGNKSLPTAA